MLKEDRIGIRAFEKPSRQPIPFVDVALRVKRTQPLKRVKGLSRVVRHRGRIPVVFVVRPILRSGPEPGELRVADLGEDDLDAPQYASALGKTANCQTLVSLTLARAARSR